MLLPATAIHFLDLNVNESNKQLAFADRLALGHATKINFTVAEALKAGIPIVEISPLTSYYFELTPDR